MDQEQTALCVGEWSLDFSIILFCQFFSLAYSSGHANVSADYSGASVSDLFFNSSWLKWLLAYLKIFERFNRMYLLIVDEIEFCAKGSCNMAAGIRQAFKT